MCAYAARRDFKSIENHTFDVCLYRYAVRRDFMSKHDAETTHNSNRDIAVVFNNSQLSEDYIHS